MMVATVAVEAVAVAASETSEASVSSANKNPYPSTIGRAEEAAVTTVAVVAAASEAEIVADSEADAEAMVASSAAISAKIPTTTVMVAADLIISMRTDHKDTMMTTREAKNPDALTTTLATDHKMAAESITIGEAWVAVVAAACVAAEEAATLEVHPETAWASEATSQETTIAEIAMKKMTPETCNQ